jgi:hypothetical protein
MAITSLSFFRTDRTHWIRDDYLNLHAYRARLPARPSCTRAVDAACYFRPRFSRGAAERDLTASKHPQRVVRMRTNAAEARASDLEGARCGLHALLTGNRLRSPHVRVGSIKLIRTYFPDLKLCLSSWLWSGVLEVGHVLAQGFRRQQPSLLVVVSS